MASKLTAAQTNLIEKLYEGDALFITNANNGIKIHTVNALRTRGVVESYITGSIDADEYHRRVVACEDMPSDTHWYLRLTEAGRELAASMFADQQPAPTPAATPVATVAAPTVKLTSAPTKLTPAQDYAIEQLWKHGNFVHLRGELRPYSSTITALRKMGLIELDETIGIWFAYRLTESGLALARSLFGTPADPQPPSPATRTARFKLSVAAPVVTNKPRNRKNQGISATHANQSINRPKNATKRQKQQKNRILATMEHKTDAAKQLRQKWANYNRTAMPTPTITGAELLGLHVVEKPRKLTRVLETGRRAA